MSVPLPDPRLSRGMARQLAARSAAIEVGAAHVGWKVAFGAPASLSLMQLDGPVVGSLTDATVLPSGAAIDVSSWERAVVEFELAVFLGADVPADAAEDAVRSAVAALAPAIEIANVDLPIGPDTLEEIVAGNVFHRAVIAGDPDDRRRGLDIAGLDARVAIDGVQSLATTDLEQLTGRYPEVVAAVAARLAHQGEMLRAGDVIIMGSVFPPRPVESTSIFEFLLDPFPPISVEIITG